MSIIFCQFSQLILVSHTRYLRPYLFQRMIFLCDKNTLNLTFKFNLNHFQINNFHDLILISDVNTLHIIPVPFPNVWHTKNDNESVINYSTVKNLMVILKAFIIQYLNGQSST